MTITPTSSQVNSVLSTGNVPRLGGAIFFVARFPATASIGTIIRKRPASIVIASVALYQCVLAFRPANAEPLLPAADVYAYRICDSPCGPWLDRLEVPKVGESTAIAEKPRITTGKIKK